MSDRFYTNSPLGPGEVVLEGPEAHHLVAVSRLSPGNAVCLFNGDGQEYAAEIVAGERRRVILRVTSVTTPQRELPFDLEVAAPLPKGDRAQFLVEKLTELGVTCFVPLSTCRSIIHPRETKLEKLQRYVIEASKQCGRNTLMRVESVADWEAYCASADRQWTRVLAHPENRGEAAKTGARDARAELSPKVLGKSGRACLAVGPEGGFADVEISAARQAGWLVIDLGPRILRVETAALVLTAWTIRACEQATCD